MKLFAVSISALFATMLVSVAAFSTPRARSSVPLPSAFGLGAVPDGWEGGFSECNSNYSYPRITPNLSDLPILDNMDNIDKLTRQQKILWPEFSWLDGEENRLYSMFSPDISRLGYTDEGRIYSIICPQQGTQSDIFGTVNLEVTVTGQRGYVNEPDHTVYGDMSVKGRIWITEGKKTPAFLKLFKKFLDTEGYPFSKANAINITTYNPGQPWNSIFELKNGTNPEFKHPLYAQHWNDAYGLGYLNVEIGEIEPTGNKGVDDFGELLLKLFNIVTGNMLQHGTTLSWNIWLNEPEYVDKEEWAGHAEKWRKSIQTGIGSPDGKDNTDTRYFDGRKFKPLKSAFKQQLKMMQDFFTSGSTPLAPGIQADDLECDPLYCFLMECDCVDCDDCDDE